MRVGVVSFCLVQWILCTRALEIRMASNYLNSMASNSVQMKPSTIKKWSPADGGGQSKMKASTLKQWSPTHDVASNGQSYVDRLSSPEASSSGATTNDDLMSPGFSTSSDLAEPKSSGTYLEELSGPSSQAFMVSYAPTKSSIAKKSYSPSKTSFPKTSNPLSGNYLEHLSEGGVVNGSSAPTQMVDETESSVTTPDKPATKPSMQPKARGYFRRQLEVDNLDMLAPISRSRY